MDARGRSADPARQPFVDRLRLEAQRRSAHYYLAEYAEIRARILSRRRQVDIAEPNSGASDRDWIRSLLEVVTAAGNGAPAGVSEDLASDVWELAVVRDQLTSDLTVLGTMLDVLHARALRRTLDSLVYPEGIAFVGLCTHYVGVSRYFLIQPLLWAAFGIFAARSCFYGMGSALLSLVRRLVALASTNVERDWVSEDDERRLSFWGWTVLQLSRPL